MEQTTLKRGAGILLPVYALPSQYGIGTLGQEALDFIDFLKESGQKFSWTEKNRKASWNF